MAISRKIERAVALDLIRAIYEREGWKVGDKGDYPTTVARCNALYSITADTRRNRYMAIRRHPSE